ncbi:MAG: hypothetical protein ACD_65C00287G0005 [uncultured bacterium]|nr:MAG: hypothetical protein ACD_65C00287G0005 [uncultured bacterium]KKT01484.1 MAG: hypothetical protein UV80_C0014G0016 [Candidatus Peregrinibacteria bacterium GW2011_GWF2_43_17]KKT18582.1 MAG: hypothetical protein UW03_C0037G0003 [Candidatus Peregrinibacteria bacterium GW2011_GWA2_43_8]
MELALRETRAGFTRPLAPFIIPEGEEGQTLEEFVGPDRFRA